ncbi:hypothetical protein [Serratia marcescens]|uniref:hypothetical protein n=1 Tax=Serratia marcescens TaxID=615 RepID=UPI00235FDAB3|nr:hypothetical protein [Serratia marcescens]
MKEELYGLANHIAGAKGGLPQEWQEWADEIEMDIRKLANREAQPVPAGKFAGWGLYHSGSDDFGSWLKSKPQGDCSDAITKHGYVNVKLFTAPPAPANARAVAWEMRYWSDGYNIWGEWERITAEQHAEMSVEHATDNDYEFRVLYDAPPEPAVPVEIRNYYRAEGLAEVLKDAREYAPLTAEQWGTLIKNWHQTFVGLSGDANACRAAMLAAAPEGGK